MKTGTGKNAQLRGYWRVTTIAFQARCSPTKVRYAIERGELIPAVLPGKTTRIPTSQAKAWAEHERSAKAEGQARRQQRRITRSSR